MRGPSSTSIFNAGIIVASALMLMLPLWWSESHLVPRYSRQYEQMIEARQAMDLGKDRPVLLLGDSTIRNLDTATMRFLSNTSMLNLAAGGAVAKEWYYSMRNAFRENPHLKAVLVGAWSGDYLVSTNQVPPYYPFLLENVDVWEEYVGGRISLERSLRLLQHLHFKTAYVNEDIISRTVSDAFPFMREFMIGLVKDEADRADQANQIGVPRSGELAGVQEILRLAVHRKVPVKFVISPVSSERRKDGNYQRAHARFISICGLLKLECVDFSNKLSDESFNNDGIHIRREQLDLYRSLLEKLLKDSGWV